MKNFSHTIKVYYEDTDAGGVVYYANYLKFMERARSDALKSLGFTNKLLIEEDGIFIVVKSCNINYFKSASLEDILEIKSIIKKITKTSFFMKQKVFKGSDQITEAEIHLVTVDIKGKPVKIPERLKEELKKLI
tara:strand:- start:74 stop:475 length:402 start_codon:yes stop_codon:yes gene_type:complete